MARTNDPSAATKKAWLTRARAGDGGGVVQQRGDFRVGIQKVGRATPITDLISHSNGAGDSQQRHRDPDDLPLEQPLSQRERDLQTKTDRFLRDGLGPLDLPAGVTDGLSGIKLCTEREMGRFPPAGDYNHITRTIRLNTGYFGQMVSDDPDGKPADRTAKVAAHEMGHHVHLSNLSDAAALEWDGLSVGGSNCVLSSNGRKNSKEHFAEAFAAYAHPRWREGQAVARFNRGYLEGGEPKSFAFMARLWRDPTMWNR